MTGRSGHVRCACLKRALLPLPIMQQLTLLQLDLALIPLTGDTRAGSAVLWLAQVSSSILPEGVGDHARADAQYCNFQYAHGMRRHCKNITMDSLQVCSLWAACAAEQSHVRVATSTPAGSGADR